jgi:dynamin 1-like protein
LEDLSPIDIKTAISNTTGPKAALFVPEAAFELLVRRQLAKLREPSLQCVDLVYDELERIIHSINFVELDRFQNLKVELIESATNLLRNCKIPSKEMISNLHNMELCFINTNHPDFQIDQIIAGVMQRRQQSQQVKQLQPQSTPQQIQQDQNQQQQQQQQYQISIPNKNIKDQQRKSQTIVSNQQISPTTNDSSLDNKGFLNFFFGPKKESNNSNNINNNKNTSVVMKPSSQIQKSEHLKLQQVPTTLNITSISGQKDFEIELLESLLCEYFNISRKNFQDLVPKTIMYLMIMKSKTEMQNELVQKLYKEQSFENLFNENPQIVQKKKIM